MRWTPVVSGTGRSDNHGVISCYVGSGHAAGCLTIAAALFVIRPAEFDLSMLTPQAGQIGWIATIKNRLPKKPARRRGER